MSETIRVTILKMNGSIWTETFSSTSEAIEFMKKNIEDYPHMVISRQKARRFQ
jgi:hypothetical protein